MKHDDGLWLAVIFATESCRSFARRDPGFLVVNGNDSPVFDESSLCPSLIGIIWIEVLGKGISATSRSSKLLPPGHSFQERHVNLGRLRTSHSQVDC
jgi:hypothetical protein